MATSRRRRLLLRALEISAIGYPIVLLLIVLVLRFVGERWWMTAVALYLPRLGFALPLPFLAAGLWLTGRRRWLWTQVPSVLLLVFPLLGFVPPWFSSGTAGAPSLRILSYNVDSARAGVDNVFAEVDPFHADIVVLQETAHGGPLEAALRERFPNVDVGDQFLLGTRFPVLEITRPDKLSYYGRERSPRFLRYVLDTPLGHVVLYNVHPISPRDDFQALRGKGGFRHEFLSGHVFSGPAAESIHYNGGLRELQISTFVHEAQAETDPVLIAGDTNTTGLSPISAEVLGAFHDGFVEASWGLGYTFPNDRRPWMRIDRVLSSAALRFTSFQVGRSKASDHRCVVADVQKR